MTGSWDFEHHLEDAKGLVQAVRFTGRSIDDGMTMLRDAIEALRELVATINRTAITLDSGAKQTLASAGHLAKASVAQSKQVASPRTIPCPVRGRRLVRG